MPLSDVVNFIGSISTISMSALTPTARLPPRGFEWPIEGEGVAVLDTQRMADKGEARDKASWCNPSEAFVLSEVLRCQNYWRGDDGGRFLPGRRKWRKTHGKDACMPWHAWIKAWTNEESHEAERKKDPHEKRERRKEDGKKEGRKESKKEIMKERSNETRKQRKHYLLGLLLYLHWVFIGVFMNASSTVATQRWIPLWSNIFNSLHVLGKLLQLCLSNHLTNSPNLVRLDALVLLNMVLCFSFRICVYQCLSCAPCKWLPLESIILDPGVCWRRVSYSLRK